MQRYSKVSNPFYKLGFKDIIFSWFTAVALGLIVVDFLLEKRKSK